VVVEGVVVSSCVTFLVLGVWIVGDGEVVGVVAIDVGWGGLPSSWVDVSREDPTPEGKKGGAVAISVFVFVPFSGRGSV
jgi:hypothetical protein